MSNQMRGPRQGRMLLAGALAFCLLGLTTGSAVAGEEAELTKEAHLAKALASGMDALKLRLDAALRRGALLEKAGKTAEAIQLYKRVDDIYVETVEELRALIRGVRQVSKVAGPRIVIGGGSGGIVVPGRDGVATPRRPFKEWPEAGARLDKSINGGLAWLARQQAEDGSWRPDQATKMLYKPGVTALATSAFLGAGYTHRGAHPMAKVVARALDYLIKLQDPEGCIGPRTSQMWTYNHALGTVALVEAYGLTRDPRLRTAAQRALDFSATARNPYFGWRYGVKPGDNDTSVTHWMVMGISRARDLNRDAVRAKQPAPFTIDQGAFDGALAWVDKMTDGDYGRAGYISRGSGPARPRDQVDRFPGEKSEAMTAAAINIRLMCGQSPKGEPVIQKGLGLLGKLMPTWNRTNGSIDMYYWLVGAFALERAQGTTWRRWRQSLARAILPNQHHAGAKPDDNAGSWDPVGVWGAHGGRVYSTAAMTLCLQAVKRGRAAGGR